MFSVDKSDRAQESDPLMNSDGGQLFNDIKLEMRNIRWRLVKENLMAKFNLSCVNETFPKQLKNTLQLSSNYPPLASRVSASTPIVSVSL